MANYTSTHTGATIDASVTIVSGSGVTQSDLTKLNAVTSSAIELNILDGVTASTAEINILDGLTATTAELNYLDGADSSITTLSLPDNTTITTFGASLIDDADAATARTTLGVDVAGTDNSTDVTLVTTSHDYLSISGQAITLGSIDISDDTNLTGGTGITLTGDTLSTTDSEIVHDNLSGFVANEHIDHSTVSISAGTGLSGGGDLTSTRTLSIDSSVVTLSGTQTLANKSISGTANTISNVHIVDDTINTLTIARGGTGGTTSAEARSNLNVDVAGTDNSTDVTLVTTSHDYLSLTGQAITLGQIDISDDTNLVGGTGITLTGDTLSTTDSEIVHDNLSGFVSNEHIDHSTVSITAGTGLSGGGDITTSRTLTTDDSAIVHDNLSGFVANEHIDHSGVSITAGAGLTGGGDITATRDIAVGAGTGVTVNADDVAIGQDVATTADVEFNSVTADIIGDIRGATKFQAKADVALNKGDAVYISGVSGTTPTVDIADANDSAKMPSFGLAASSVSINASVEIITFGTLAGLNTSAFSVGDIIYISTNGTSGNTLTATAPSGETSLIQNIGKVQRSHASAGSIKVGGAGRSNATPNLDDGNIFIGNGSNQAVTASLNTKIEDYLDGGTSTANFDTISVDGAEITATPAELNVLDGITSTTAELNYTDGVTSNIQTQLDAKAPLASPAFTGTATGANLTLSGDLTVNGSTTTLDTTNLAVEDNLMELNAGVTSNANDSGFLIERGSTGDNAIFMWDESADKFTLGTTTATGTTTGDITLSSTGTLVANVEGDVTGAVTGNADTATTLATARNFSLTGDVTAGAVSFDGSGNVALSTTIAANSVALGTDTTGNYMSDLTEGTGIDISHTPGEGSNGTITLDLTEVGFGGGANRLITDDGDGTVSTESNLTFDGTNLDLPDSKKVRFGTDNDFEFYHDNTNAVINNTKGDLQIYNNADDKDIVLLSDDGAGGTTAYLTLDGSAVQTKFSKNAKLLDNVELRLGDSNDLKIYHNVTDSLIENQTGDLIIRNNATDKDIILKSDNGSGGLTNYIQLDGSEVETVFNQKIKVEDSKKLAIGSGRDFSIEHDGSHNYMKLSNGNLYFRDQSNNNIFQIYREGGGIQLSEGDLKIPATSKLYLDGGSNTYIFEESADNVIHYVGGQNKLRFNSTGTILNDAGLALDFRVEGDTDPNLFFVDGSTDRVGIGTNSPSYKLDVNGGIRNYANGSAVFRTESTAAGYGAYNKLITTTNTYDLYALNGDFKIDENGVATRLIIKDTTGNVGIGTTSPSFKLKVNVDNGTYTDIETIAAFQSKRSADSDTEAGLFINAIGDALGGQISSNYYYTDNVAARGNTGRSGAIFGMANNAGAAGTHSSFYWQTSPNNSNTLTDRMILDTSGNLLIGTSSNRTTVSGYSPRLNTEGAGAAGYVQIVDTENSQFHGGTLALHKYRSGGISANTELGSLYFGGTDSANSTYAQGALIKAYAQGTDSTSNVATDLAFFTNTGSAMTRAMTIDDSQNVGIGTTSPSAKLDVVGSGNAGIEVTGGSGYVAGYFGTDFDYVAKFESFDASAAIVLEDSNSTGNYNRIGVATHDMFFVTNNSERLRIDSQGNLKFADNGTNPTAVANTAFMFNDGGELKVLDELGNTTTISPHNFSLIPDGASEERAWGYYSEKDIVDDEGNVTATQKVNVDMMKLARLVEELTGEKLVYTEED